MNRHLNDDELLDRLYGLADAPEHLESCADCARRWNQLRERRAEIAAPREVSREFLAAQRRKIYSRLGENPHGQRKWIPAALAAACLLAIGLFVYRPEPPRQHPDSADAQLFSEVYSMEQTTEPRAAAPIHALFEDNQ
jgi:hypothetical protein